MYEYIHFANIHLHIYLPLYTYTNICTSTYVYTHKYMYTYLRIYKQIRTYFYISTYTDIYMHTSINIHIYICAFTCISIDMHICEHTHSKVHKGTSVQQSICIDIYMIFKLRIHMYKHINLYIQTYIQKWSNMSIHVHIFHTHACIPTYRNICIYIHIHVDN